MLRHLFCSQCAIALAAAVATAADEASTASQLQHNFTLISLSPESIKEIYPSTDLLTNPDPALDGAQLFWATADINFAPPALQQAEFAIVHKYQGIPRQELPAANISYAWGSLDSLINERSAPEFWARPSAAFYAPGFEADNPFTIDFSAYYDKLPTEGKNAFDSLLKKKKISMLKLVKRPDSKDFSTCPWDAMLLRQHDEPLCQKWNDEVKKLTGSAAHPLWLKQWQRFRSLCKKQAPANRGEVLFTPQNRCYLNKQMTAYDGLLHLRDSASLASDFGRSARTHAKKHTLHFLPLCAQARVNEQNTPILKAVIQAHTGTSLHYMPQGFVLAVFADWDAEKSTADAITLNNSLHLDGGSDYSPTNNISLPVPEFSKIDRNAILVSRAPGSFSVRWATNSSVPIQNSCSSISPVAYTAGAEKICIKALVALPKYRRLHSGNLDSTVAANWRISASSENVTEHVERSGMWELKSPTPLMLDFPQHQNLEKINYPRGVAAFQIKKNTAETNALYSITPVKHSSTDSASHIHHYDLYLVSLESANDIHAQISAGLWALRWHIRYAVNNSKSLFCGLSYTSFPEVYTIFGESTWHKNGVINDMPAQFSDKILPWPDLLKRLTTEMLADHIPTTKLPNWESSDEIIQIYLKTMCNGICKNTLYPPQKLGNFIKWKLGQYRKDYNISDIPVFYNNGNVIPNEKILYKSLIGYTISSLNSNNNFSSTSFHITHSTKESLINQYYICMDAADTLAVYPRICGFPQIIGVIGVFSKRSGHAYNFIGVPSGNNVVYDPTPYTYREDKIPVLEERQPAHSHEETIEQYNNTNQYTNPQFFKRINLLTPKH